MRFVCATTWMVLLLGSTVGAQQPTIRARLAAREVYLGDSAKYIVELNNVPQAVEPDVTGIQDATVRKLDSQVQSSQAITIINGQQTVVSRNAIVYTFALTPQAAGTLTIPGATATVNGKVLRAADLELRVLDPPPQNSVLFEIQVDRSVVYPMQPFEVRAVISVEALPEPLAERDPVESLARMASRLPALTLPWVDDDQLPMGLSPARSWRDWIGDIRSSRSGGFSINGLSARSQFGFGVRPVAFLVESVPFAGAGEDGKQRKYRRYVFARTFQATLPGTYTFGPAKLQGDFVSDIRRDRARLESVYAVAKSLDVRVREVPTQGRPADFVGAIGKFRFDVDVNPKQARVGQPLTLTMRLVGQGNVDSIIEPDLLQVPNIAERFKLYDSTAETDAQSRTFSMSIRPKVAGQLEFPPIAVSYFDVEQEKYVSLQSVPVPLEVSAVAGLQADDIAADSSRAPTGDLEVQSGGIFGNITEMSDLANERVDAARWLICLTAVLGAFVVAWVSVGRLRQSATQERKWKQHVFRDARERLGALTADGNQLSGAEAAELVCETLFTVVAELSGTADASLTSQDVLHRVASWSLDESGIERLHQLLAKCDEARFGGVISVTDIESDADAVLLVLERAALGHRGRS